MSSRTHRRDSPGSSLEIYLKDIKETPLLSAHQERELAARVAAGETDARDHMIRANLRLVVTIARDYLGRGLGLEDLIAEGNLGLMRAVESFDPAMGTRFVTYAAYWIKESIRRASMNQGKTIRLPAHMVKLLSKWRKASAALSERLGRPATPEEIGRELRLSKKKTAMAMQALQAAESAPQDAGAGDHDYSLETVLSDDRGKAPDAMLIESDDREQISRWLKGLDDREAAIIKMRFGLPPFEPMTLREAGERLGVVRERARQLEDQAMRRLLSWASRDASPAESPAPRAEARGKPPSLPRAASRAMLPPPSPTLEGDGPLSKSRPGGTGPAPGPGCKPQRPAAENEALMLFSGGPEVGTCPARFLSLGPRTCRVGVSARPRPRDKVAICLVEPVRTEWSWATVAAVETAGDGPHRIALAFSSAVPRALRDALVPRARPGVLGPRADPDASKEGPGRLLIVEDDDVTRQALRSLFRRRGYEVVTAATLAEAMEQLDPAPSCVLLDLVLPDGDGETLLRKVRTDALPTRVAVCTGMHDQARLDRLTGLRPHAVLRKPVDPDELVRACSGFASSPV